ncbi:hypothetical protein LTR04_001258 [Oleoguttula sp. CCFEE 6159]|nr:hypothetical protein LTR04_001258 [Oleoguttula sp. CCFEE 6159]
MATVFARPSPLPGRISMPPPHLSINTSDRGTPAAIPNKYLPICSPGPKPNSGLDTPPASPPSPSTIIETTSITYPPDVYEKISDTPPVYSIDADTLVDALDHIATQPLPEARQVFPWLHGLHAENHIQLTFFVARRKTLRRTPKCIRGITLVKVGGDLSVSKLKGAIAPEEILLTQAKSEDMASFLEIDPREGFSVRNFQIQTCKLATISDVVVYGDDQTPREEVANLAKRISRAQEAWREKCDNAGNGPQLFNTFVVSDAFSKFEDKHRSIVAIDSQGRTTGNVIDFFHRERLEMCTMSKASEISKNVWLGPTPDPAIDTIDTTTTEDSKFDVLIETSDLAQVPDSRTYRAVERILNEGKQPPQMEFPSSGSIMPPTWSQAEVDGLMATCSWIYRMANPDRRKDSGFAEKDKDGDSIMVSTTPKARKTLIHCTDGYTETSLLGLAYFMYAEGLPVHEAWPRLHREKRRNFFAYPSDVALLTSIQPRILQESPRFRGDVIGVKAPQWLSRMDGSLPSRILPYMYLGNLNHANNPELLKELGITRILSVGEPISWSREVDEKWPSEHLLYVDRVQDNGVDALTEDFERCLKFLDEGKREGTATLVHCRVGVSSCFVRARRLNVIIQPHLRFSYELLKWEEHQLQKRGQPLRRELEWATIAREIALMNKPYGRQN